MSKRPASRKQESPHEIPDQAPCDLLLLHTRLHSEDAAWSASVEDSIGSLPVLLQKRILRYQRPHDRCAQALAKWILIKACHEFGIGDSTLDSLRYDERGRPTMANLHGSDFNLSHAGERVVCAVSAQGPIGVDVEKVREVEAEDFNDVFPPDAWDRLRAAGMKKTAFFREWTRLEAVAKAEGCGMSGGLRGMESDGSVTQFAGRTWYVNEVALDEGYACHVAGVSPDPVISMQACFWDGKGLQDE